MIYWVLIGIFFSKGGELKPLLVTELNKETLSDNLGLFCIANLENITFAL